MAVKMERVFIFGKMFINRYWGLLRFGVRGLMEAQQLSSQGNQELLVVSQGWKTPR